MTGKASPDGAVGRDARGMLLGLLRSHVAALALVLGLMLVQSLATLLQPFVGGLLANRLLFAQGFGGLLWVLFGLVCAQAAVGYAVSIQLRKVSGLLVADAGTRLYATLQGLPLAWHQERHRGDVLALLSGDVARLGNYLAGTLMPLLPLLVTLVGGLLMMFRLAPLIAVAVALLIPLMVVAVKLAGRWLRPLGYASMQAWADQTALAEQNLELLPVIKAFATGERETARYRALSWTVHATDLKQAKLQGVIAPMVHVVGAGLVLLLLGVAGHRIIRAEMGVGDLVSLFLYGLVLVNPISQLASVYGNTHAARGAAQRVLAALDAAPEADQGMLDMLPRHADIHYRGVHFAYPGREPLFRGFDLHVRAGETVAITGANGAGKSTLVHLLLRLVEPQAGAIFIGDADVRDYRLAALRGQVGLVAQHVMLFNDSIAGNIAYGHADATREAIERAARAARAHDFITQLPDGYDSVIGDQGVKLSGGQKQRIALARALLKDPPILVLDEATAMFDPAGEREFIAECHEVLRERTVILITHRPASLALADRVLFLNDGVVSPVVPESTPFGCLTP